MKHYKISGEYRLQNAIGRMESFTRTIEADNPKQAMDKNREELYTAGYDHILHMQIKVRTGRNTWVNIPMLKALGLE